MISMEKPSQIATEGNIYKKITYLLHMDVCYNFARI
jgi:hypothetical protein